MKTICIKYPVDKVLPDEHGKCSLCGGECTDVDYKSYRDIPRATVEEYADQRGLNIETAENFKMAAIELFNGPEEDEEPVQHVKCNMCTWRGTESDLIPYTDEEGDECKGCPKCKNGDNYLMNYDQTERPIITVLKDNHQLKVSLPLWMDIEEFKAQIEALNP